MAKRVPEIQIDLTELNHSELVVLAKWCGLPASRAFPREDLINSLETFIPIDLPLPIVDVRNALMGWLNRWISKLRMQFGKKVCPACNNCRELQVLACFKRNESQIVSKPPRR